METSRKKTSKHFPRVCVWIRWYVHVTPLLRHSMRTTNQMAKMEIEWNYPLRIPIQRSLDTLWKYAAHTNRNTALVFAMRLVIHSGVTKASHSLTLPHLTGKAQRAHTYMKRFTRLSFQFFCGAIGIWNSRSLTHFHFLNCIHWNQLNLLTSESDSEKKHWTQKKVSIW